MYELWGVGKTYDEVHQEVKAHPERWPPYNNKSFKFIVSAFGSTSTTEHQLRVINSFAYLGFQGDIVLKNPDVVFSVCEDFGLEAGALPPSEPCMIYFGRLIASGSRHLIRHYDVKKRRYIGNTTMDAELSLIMANQALAAPGKLVYDPFMGTGSFLMTCAHFGAITMGSDIDGRQIRGRENRSVKSNIEQYSASARVLDTLVFDVCHHPWRDGAWFDALITDPPYGVRAGAKTLGRKIPSKKRTALIDGVSADKHLDYIPPTKPYEMSQVVTDIIEFAAKYLVLGGRLVYWLPTVTEEYHSTDVPSHPSFVVVSNSEQNFGHWARRLITMEKVKLHVGSERATVNATALDSMSYTNVFTSIYHKRKLESATSGSCIQPELGTGATVTDATDEHSEDSNNVKALERKPGHYQFREKYFASKSNEKFGRSRFKGGGVDVGGSIATTETIDACCGSKTGTERVSTESSKKDSGFQYANAE